MINPALASKLDGMRAGLRQRRELALQKLDDCLDTGVSAPGYSTPADDRMQAIARALQSDDLRGATPDGDWTRPLGPLTPGRTPVVQGARIKITEIS